ncbi:hypothetical protein L1987_39312 [Smallanthus sonchifolius]|uniref:Uncharacterized protein n=1 Tax=Smallanthus sonchifolius TaxID=185202 RepID=A0ACB9HLF6_9ASTR|nr:hypothetical protein L1987_39312 [Smallanthus sonchifolius]
MGNLLNSLANMLMKKKKPLHIETISRFSTQPRDFPQGNLLLYRVVFVTRRVGFATGTIDLGGLEVCQVSSFNKIWATHEGGPDNLGATFYEPSSIPEGFFLLGHYSQCNNKPLFGWVLGGRPSASDPSSLARPTGRETSPSPVEPDGSNLPQGGSDDDSYWLDLPVDDSTKVGVKKGDLDTANAYFHIKPMFDATFTDIAIWVFYPFNGPTRAKLEFLTISLGKIGEHVGDWEHLTLRVSNFDGTLKSVYFSKHSGGTLLDVSQLEFENGNKPVAYASLNGHTLYSKPGLVLQGNGRNGIRNDTAKGKAVMDTGVRAAVVAIDHLTTVEPSWLSYSRKWGPKLSYELAKEIERVKKVLPGRLKESFEKVISGVPNEVLGEEGPSGPKMKNNWNGDEKY